MDIRNPNSGETLSSIDVELTTAEAMELRDVFEDLLVAPFSPGRHEHVSSADYQVEITVWLREGKVDRST